MKKIILATVGVTALFSSLTALAGPDFYVIEKARAAKHTEVQLPAARDVRANNGDLQKRDGGCLDPVPQH